LFWPLSPFQISFRRNGRKSKKKRRRRKFLKSQQRRNLSGIMRVQYHGLLSVSRQHPKRQIHQRLKEEKEKGEKAVDSWEKFFYPSSEFSVKN